MKKIKITHKDNPEGWTEQLPDEVAQAWIDKMVTANAWGLPERAELDAEGNPTGVILPAEYTVEIEDITAQVAQYAINSKALEYLAATDWLIIREMDSGVLCPADIKAERVAARARIVR